MTFTGKKRAVLALAAFVGLVSALPAAADRGWGWGGFGFGLASGALIGTALARPYYPYYYYPPYYAAYPTTVVVQQQPMPVAAPPAYAAAAPMPPPAYGGAAPPAPPVQSVWYYCESARGYYPYVSSCPEPWRPMPAH